MIGKCGQRVSPHRIDVSAQLSQALRIEPEVMAGTAPFLIHQAYGFQHLEMLRNRGTTDWKATCQLADCRRTPSQQLENGLPGRVGKRRQPLS